MSEKSDPRPRASTLSVKPPAEVCPGVYCFHYVRAGGLVAHGLYPNVEAALSAAEPAPDSYCGCTFGLCTRLGAPGGDRDWYEPHEPELKRAGLPWFFFIPSADRLTPELREEYLRESARLWGPSSGGK